MSRRVVPRALRTPTRAQIPTQGGGSAADPPRVREPVPADPPERSVPLPRASRRWFAVAAIVLVAAVAGGGAIQADQRAAEAATARREGLAAAVSAATVILSYDHTRMDADIAAATARTTGKFRAEYRETSKAVAPVAEQYQAVVSATVTASAVVSASPDQVVTLLFVDQSTRSTRITGTKVDQARVRMTMSRDAGKWLVSRVEAL
ncbi:MAG: molecular chaperone DnaJ [Actinomycetia bacterium]|jgi:Mce-associated membrane protein|nr:molecular chaperone DnaJ [Actinomycetes bacterium]MDQ1658309.1 Mce-associated rane protein [Cryptosporangiaceae bacterium]